MSEAEQCPSNVRNPSYHRNTRMPGMCTLLATVAGLVADVSLMNVVDLTVLLPFHKNLNLQVVRTTAHTTATPHVQISIFNRAYSSV